MQIYRTKFVFTNIYRKKFAQMEISEKKDKLNSLFTQLYSSGKVHTKKQFAEYMGMSYSNIVMAMNGDERYLTDKLIKRVEQILERPSIEAHASGNSNVVIGDGNISASGDVQLAVLKSENEMLRAQLEDRDKQIEFLKSLINK